MRAAGRFRLPLFVALVAVVSMWGAPALAAPTLQPQIALTIDDVPINVTPILGVLADKNVKATFFMVGQYVEANPTQARAVASAGMLIGNHSYDHADLTGASVETVRANLTQAQNSIGYWSGQYPRWFRSPFLIQNAAYDVVLPELGLQHSWPTIDPEDWAGTSSTEIVSRVVSQRAPGGVVLLHDGDDQQNTVAALPTLIDQLRAHGYEFITLDDLGKCAIAGTVTGPGGQPLSGASVTILNSQGNSVGSTVTSANGTYRVARLSPGTYRVRFSAPPYDIQYYGGSASLAGAEAFVVGANYAATGVSARMVDATDPETTLSPALPTGWVNRDVTFSLSAQDGASSSGMVTWYQLSPYGSVSAYGGPVVVSQEGMTTISYWSVDGAGNAETQHQADVRIDKSAPVTSCDARAAYAGTATVGFSATDAHSGVGTTYCRLDGGPAAEATSVAIAKPGTYEVSYWSVDRAGNSEAQQSRSFVVNGGSSVALSTKSAVVGYGARTAISGTLALDGDRGGRAVRLQSSANGTTWTDSSTTSVTDASGAFTLSCAPTSKTYYRVRFAGDSVFGASTSGAVTMLPRAKVTSPITTSSPKRNRSFSAYGYLTPRHASGSKPIRLLAYRYERGRWVYRRSFTATVRNHSTFSRYSTSVKLPYTGRWRIRAYHGDSDHAATYSTYRYVTVK